MSINESDIDEILNNDDLIVGDYYHCFDRVTGKHSIQQCFDHPEGYKYIGISNIWATDDNSQALERWKMFPVTIPMLNTINLCSEHHGYGFISDCVACRRSRKENNND